MHTNLRFAHGGEIGKVLEADGATKGGRYRIKVIQPGKGSSGIYTEANLAASAPLFKAGTHMFMDHPGKFEDDDRPERSVKDLAGRLTTDAEVGPDGALYAECFVFPSFDAIIREKWDSIGVSINAWCTQPMEADGTVPVLAGVTSVDFVTKAGAGGAILDILESQRVEADNNTTQKEYRMHEEIKEAIASAITEAITPVTESVTGLVQRVEALEALEADRKKKTDEPPFAAGDTPTPGVDEKPTDKEAEEKKRRKEALEASRTVLDSGLPKAAQDRAFAAIEAGAPAAEAVDTERNYLESVRESRATTDASDTPTIKTIPFA